MQVMARFKRDIIPPHKMRFVWKLNNQSEGYSYSKEVEHVGNEKGVRVRGDLSTWINPRERQVSRASFKGSEKPQGIELRKSNRGDQMKGCVFSSL
jgi:hypothetical protein